MKTTGRLAAAALSLTLAASASAAEDDARTLYLFNWTEYMPPAVLTDFEQEFDARVVQNFFTSNAEMFSKLLAGGDAQYDVIVPTDYYVPRLIDAGLIQPLDHQQLPGLDHLMPAFRNPSYDPGNQHSVPYQWGAAGIVYDPEALGDVPHSWSALFDPQLNPDHPFTLLGGDPQVIFGAACAQLGHGFDCTQREQWIEAAQLLLETRRRGNFAGFSDSTAAVEQIVRGISTIGMTFNGDLAWRQAESPEIYGNLRFFIPEKGSQRGIDTLAIPTHAPHPALAHQFIAFTLRPDIAARISNYTYYATPNAEALAELDPALRQPPSALSEAEMARLEFVPPLDSAQLEVLSRINQEMRGR